MLKIYYPIDMNVFNNSFLFMDELNVATKIGIAIAAAALLIGGFSFMIFSQRGDSDTPKYTQIQEGLEYRIIHEGSGEKVQNLDTVEVHYVGKFEDGSEFDNSRGVGRTGEPFQFQVGAGEVIQGWDLGVIGMRRGEKRELIIAPELGYGSRGAGGVIPPNTTLYFEVELIDIL